MAIKASGTISLSDIQAEFGGSNPIALNEYYSADTGVPSSGTISVNQFYGRSKQLTASYTQQVAYSIPSGAGGIGEGYFRTAASWTNYTDRKGYVRFWGTVGVGGARGYGTKITGYQLVVGGVGISYYPATFGGPAFWSWDSSVAVDRGTYAYLSVYAWGGFGGDRVKSGTWYVGYN